ncbi:hypothetical protein CSIM01_10830 [Colletotrichum simmondsii]|uniref:Uncharacterized protein n=1 Tax=Colletotrichum simmondsii TaxID=703756 RepID=A0A135RN49_9PEZI|nr:hypothetical protein CSIM01_10830 [Colletotrichum simmondsii]
MESVETDIRKRTQYPEEQSLFLINAWSTLDVTNLLQDDFDKHSGLHFMVVLVRMMNSMLPADDREQQFTLRRNDVNPSMTRKWRNAPQHLKSDSFIRMIERRARNARPSSLVISHDQGLLDRMIWHPERGFQRDATYENDHFDILGEPKDIAETIESMSFKLANDGPETFCYVPRIPMYSCFLYTPDADRSDDDTKKPRSLAMKDERPDAENPKR